MERMQKSVALAVLLSETTHVFCCVLPTIVSLFSLLAGLGLISVVPGFLTDIHDTIHAYEVPMIIASAAILALGWGLHALSVRLDCRSTGCGHPPCTPKKKNASKILWVATALFTINVCIYAAVHVPMTAVSNAGHQHEVLTGNEGHVVPTDDHQQNHDQHIH